MYFRLSLKKNKCLVLFLLSFILLSSYGCETTGGSSKGRRGPSGKESQSSSSSEDRNISRNRVSHTQSMNNNALTPHVFSRGGADKIIASLEGKNLGVSELEALLSAQRLRGVSYKSILGTAKKIASEELKKNIRAEPSEFVRLELGIAAVASKQFAMAEFYLIPLQKAKNKKVQAGASNALGIMALIEGRIPEAVAFWKESLKSVSNYEPARLNIGYTAIKYADLKSGGRYLSAGGDWYIDSALAIVNRFSGRESAAKRLCEKVLDKKPNHKTINYNCGLLELQNFKNFGMARTLITKAVKAPGGKSSWEEEGYRTLSRIDSLQFQLQQQKAAKAKQERLESEKKKALEAEKKQAAEAAKNPAKSTDQQAKPAQ